LAIENDLIPITDVLLCAVFFVHGFVAAPYVVVNSVHLVNLAKSQPLENVTMRFVTIEAVAFFAKIIFTVSAMIEYFIEVISFDIGTLSPGATPIETLATTVCT
jgi:hypothetical protein